jgi:hypothetical protein
VNVKGASCSEGQRELCECEKDEQKLWGRGKLRMSSRGEWKRSRADEQKQRKELRMRRSRDIEYQKKQLNRAADQRQWKELWLSSQEDQRGWKQSRIAEMVSKLYQIKQIGLSNFILAIKGGREVLGRIVVLKVQVGAWTQGVVASF